METEEKNDSPTSPTKADQLKKENTNTSQNNNMAEEKVIPLMPADNTTLADKITVTSNNEDILTPVVDDKND